MVYETKSRAAAAAVFSISPCIFAISGIGFSKATWRGESIRRADRQAPPPHQHHSTADGRADGQAGAAASLTDGSDCKIGLSPRKVTK